MKNDSKIYDDVNQKAQMTNDDLESKSQAGIENESEMKVSKTIIDKIDEHSDII